MRGGRREGLTAAVAALGVGVAVFVLYFAAYPIRHLTLPVGFDPPWYVWHAEHLATRGIGTGSVAARPGYAVLSAVLGAVTGRPQLELTVILSLVLVSLLALAVGAFASVGLGFRGWRWVVVVAAAGAIIGPTHLVGENLSNTLNLVLEITALAALAAAVGGARGLAGAVALLVAAGLAHWDFLAVALLVLGVVAAMALPSSRLDASRGLPPGRTEAGLVAWAAAWSAGLVGAVVLAVLRAPLSTVEIGSDELLFRRKFRTDVARLAVPEVAGLVGPWLLPAVPPVPLPDPGPAPSARARRWAFSLRTLRAWTYVTAGGIVVGLITFALPPARFLALLVALPGALTMGAILVAVGRWVAGPQGRRRVLAVTATVALVSAMAIPGILRWYRYPVLLDPAAVRQARTAASYVAGLPEGQPIIFLVDTGGRPGVYAAVVKERTILMALDPGRQLDAHVYVGALKDLEAGRRTPSADERTERATRFAWDDVRPFLGRDLPVVVVRAMAGRGFADAVAEGGALVASDVVVVNGPPSGPVPAAPPVEAVPGWVEGLGWGTAVLALLLVAGAGWTWAILGPGAPAEWMVAAAPAVGAGALVLGGFVAAELGWRLGGSGGWAVYLVMAGGGPVVGWALSRRRPPSTLPSGGDPRPDRPSATT